MEKTIQETYGMVKNKYESIVKPIWETEPFRAETEFLDVYQIIEIEGKKFAEYHSGLAFFGNSKYMNDKIMKNILSGCKLKRTIQKTDIENFEMYLAQVGLSIKSENKF